MVSERDATLKAAIKSKLTTDRSKIMVLRNKVTREIRKGKANFFVNIIDQAKGNSKLIWESMNKLTGKRSGGGSAQKFM